MVASQEENIREFEKNLTKLTRSQSFIDQQSSFIHARKLSELLTDLQASTPEPCLGVVLMTHWYETSAVVLGAGKDLEGAIGSIYTNMAKDLFVGYAQSCKDTETITNSLMHLCQNTLSSSLISLMDSASLFLDETKIRSMIEKLQIVSDEQQDPAKRNFYQDRVLSFATQIKDAKLFETTLLALQGEIPASIIEITRMYLACDDVASAYAWIQKFSNDTIYLRKRYISILTEIYRRQGDTENLARMLKKRLRKLHKLSVLQEVLDVIGEDARQTVIDEEIPHILNNTMFSLTNLTFLLDVGRIKDAETYLFARTDEIADIWHSDILPIATRFEEQNNYLASTLIYRSLLEFILENADTSFYPEAASFLRKLDALESVVSDWKEYPNHVAYKEMLAKSHGRKRSFWAQYARKHSK